MALPHACVQGPSDHTLAQIKDAIRDGLRAVANTLLDKKVVRGAGAFEARMTRLHSRSLLCSRPDRMPGLVAGFHVPTRHYSAFRCPATTADRTRCMCMAQQLFFFLGNGCVDAPIFDVACSGACQVAAAHHLQEVTRKTVEGRAKLGVSAFAEALLGIPKILAENSGFDAQVAYPFPLRPPPLVVCWNIVCNALLKIKRAQRHPFCSKRTHAMLRFPKPFCQAVGSLHTAERVVLRESGWQKRLAELCQGPKACCLGSCVCLSMCTACKNGAGRHHSAGRGGGEGQQGGAGRGHRRAIGSCPGGHLGQPAGQAPDAAQRAGSRRAAAARG